MPFTLRKLPLWRQHLYSALFSVFCMITATCVAFLYYHFISVNYSNILIYILALMLVSRYARGYLYGILCCLYSIISFNYLFTYPFYQINFTLAGYPINFLLMSAITIITSTMTSHLALQAELIAEREKQLAEAEMEKMRANLLRAISHDLRTPLTGIIGNSSVYLENGALLKDGEKKELIENIYNDSTWLLNMVENLLTITRIKGDDFIVATEEESVEEVISESLQKFEKRYPQSKVEVFFPQEYILLPMDAILIEQVTINLLENAYVHSESQHSVCLIVEDLPDRVSFTIRDYGIGIPENMLEHLFDGSSYNTGQSTDAHKGMGIGLSLCKTIITAHHGTIAGRNHAHGAEFVFTLPKKM